MSNILYSGFDTLVFSTTKFHIQNSLDFSNYKAFAGEERNKEYAFEYGIDKEMIIDGVRKNMQGFSVFLMRSTSFNPFAWSFYDKDKLFLFNVVYSEFKMIFQVKVLAKAFMKYKSFTALKYILQDKLSLFGITLDEMKVKRIDYAVDIKYQKKKINIWSKRKNFLESGLYTRYSSLLKPSRKDYYTKDYGKEVGVYTTGFYVGSKSVLLRTYDKVLESLEKYDENPSKNETLLMNYYPKSTLIDNEFNCEVQKYNTDLNYWNLLLLETYLNDKVQVVRFEYQLKDTYISNKFETVADLNIEDVKCLLEHTFKNHSGFMPKNLDKVKQEKAIPSYERDVQLYIDHLSDNDGSISIISKLESDIDRSINRSVRLIGSQLVNIASKMSQKYEKLFGFSEEEKLLNHYYKFIKEKISEKLFNKYTGEYFKVGYIDKMYSDFKVMFSHKKFRTGILDFIEFEEYKGNYRDSLIIS